MDAADEGVIKFAASHTNRPLGGDQLHDLTCQLVAWRTILTQTGLIGQDPSRYGGAGFGNVSARLGPHPGDRGARRFLVTGTQTSGQQHLTISGFCVVEAYDAARNEVRSYGPVLPSSESMTHGAVYDLSPAIRFVFHGHCAILWRAAERLAIPTTRTSVAYGTPEMAQEVGRLYRTSALPERRVISMGGHEDGILVFGKTADEAGFALLTSLAAAYLEDCRHVISK